MKHIFNPKTIALIGASEKPKTVGSGLASNLLKSKQKVFFVNPNDKKVFSKKTYASILDIKEKIDLVIIAVPAKIVIKVTQECILKKVKGIIVISAGFSEQGNNVLEKELVDMVQAAKIPLIGPNCLGILNPKNKLNASFAPFSPNKGGIALLSQSGAIIDSIIDLSIDEKYGFSKIISFGNEADLDLSDYLEFLNNDKETKVIAIYLEGLKNGRKFIEVVQKIKKPIIILKSGKSNAGKKATMTHTGSLAGNNRVYEAVFKSLNIIEVNSIEELLDASKALSWQKQTKNGVGIITNGGGFGILASDELEKNNVKITKIKEQTTKALENDCMKNVNLKNNPLDVIGDALADRYEIAIEALLKQNNIYSLLIIQGMQIMTEPEKTAKIIVDLQKKYNKPIVCSFVGGKSFKKAINIIEKNKIPNFKDPKRAASIIKYLTHE